MVTALIGKKVGMTQVYQKDGSALPATVIKAGPCVVVQMKTTETDGYQSVQLGLVEDKPAKANKAMAGHYKKAGVPPTRVRREIPLATAKNVKGAEAPKAGDDAGTSVKAGDDAGTSVKAGDDAGTSVKAGDQFDVTMFKAGDRVDVIGTTRGKGFQGVMKRHNFAGGAATHGSMFHRAPGSIGASSYPSRVVKGMRAPGHMGNTRVTTKNLKIVQIDAENNLLVLHGAVPGSPGGYLVIRRAITAKPETVPQVEKVKKGKK
ncbi:MAG: 50S ribosomal protein L3 [Acidobacteria bacterium]|nr:50S ribosomal protein L3 [Acidobacteriota bacterium]